MAQARQICPNCFAPILADVEICPACGRSMAKLSAHDFRDKLLRALHHPLSEVRMRVIIALGLRGEAETADALVECALRHPADVVEGLEIIRSLTRIREPGIRRRQALLRLIAQHAAHAVRAAAEKASTLTTDESMMNAGTEDERR